MKKVVVGMSGGVDSSVAALLLKNMGYEVIGVTMQIWEGDNDSSALSAGCCGISAAEDARRVCEVLGIAHYVMDFREVFCQKVIEPFTKEYLSGRTPNPCIECNRHVKWEELLTRSLAIGADLIATGHYAKVVRLENGRFSIRTSVSSAKDQTYALYTLSQFQLSHTLLPIGDYEKGSVRQIALDAHLPVYDKPDSQEICFVPDNDYAGFIERRVGASDVPKEGNFISKDGRVLGRHRGITHYTIGQRRGLNLAMGMHVYVCEIRTASNEIVIGEDKDVFSDTLTCRDLNFMSVEDLGIGQSERVFAKVRYRHAGEWCRITRVDESRIQAVFEKPVRAITPGQAAVFYKDGVIYGGGTIE